MKTEHLVIINVKYLYFCIGLCQCLLTCFGFISVVVCEKEVCENNFHQNALVMSTEIEFLIMHT